MPVGCSVNTRWRVGMRNLLHTQGLWIWAVTLSLYIRTWIVRNPLHLSCQWSSLFTIFSSSCQQCYHKALRCIIITGTQCVSMSVMLWTNQHCMCRNYASNVLNWFLYVFTHVGTIGIQGSSTVLPKYAVCHWNPNLLINYCYYGAYIYMWFCILLPTCNVQHGSAIVG